jgi:hypothetical protein
MVIPTLVLEKSPFYCTHSANGSDNNITPNLNLIAHNYWLRSVSSTSPELEPEGIGESAVVEWTSTPDKPQHPSSLPGHSINPAIHGGPDSDRLTSLLESFSRTTRGHISTSGLSHANLNLSHKLILRFYFPFEGENVCRKILKFIANPNRSGEYMVSAYDRVDVAMALICDFIRSNFAAFAPKNTTNCYASSRTLPT